MQQTYHADLDPLKKLRKKLTNKSHQRKSDGKMEFWSFTYTVCITHEFRNYLWAQHEQGYTFKSCISGQSQIFL
jgi:hypothetical protein